MKIDAYKLRNFVKKASLNGTMSAINMEFKDDGVHSRMMEAGKVALTDTLLKKEAFDEYGASGEIFIKDTVAFMNYLNTFGSYVNITINEDYVMSLSDNTRSGVVMLGAEVACDGVYREPLPTLKHTHGFNLQKTDIDRTVRDLSMLKTNKTTIFVDEQGLGFSIGDVGQSDSFNNRVVLDQQTEDAEVTIGDNFTKIFDCLEGEFTLSLGTGLPIQIVESNEIIDFTCIIAPIIEN